MNREAAEPASNVLPKSLFGYEVVDRIGLGAGSTIYAVTERQSGQLYALKHVVCKTDRDRRFVDQLENEFAVSRQFRHPGLRKYYHCKVNKSLLRSVTDAALIMEMVHGTTFDKLKPQTLGKIIDYFAQTAKAISALHYLLYVHCDLKPNNIIVDDAGQVKIIDFGQACRAGTAKRRIQGTPDFIAPEQVRLKPVTVQTDVYSFGATLYWALVGVRVPTLYTVGKEKADIILECRFPSPHDRNGSVPQALSDLVMDCLRGHPTSRPRDMDTVLARLEAVR